MSKNRQTGKRIGYAVLSLTPFLATLLLQTGVVIAVLFVLLLLRIMQGGGGADAAQMTAEAAGFLLDHYIEVLLIVQTVMLAVFGLWYGLAFIRKQPRRRIAPVFLPRSLAGLALLGLGMYLATGIYLMALGMLSPETLAQYDEMIAQSGLADLTFLSTVSSMVLSPVCEEMTFRGLTLGYLHRAGAPFWLANLLQALLFAAAHMNLVQGIYAFALGLVLGCVVRRFGTLAASMVLHCIFNFYGTYLATALGDAPDGLWACVASAAGAVVALLLARRLLAARDRGAETGSAADCTERELPPQV